MYTTTTSTLAMKLVLLSGFLLAAVSAFAPSPNVQPRLSLALGVGDKEPSPKFDMDELRKRIVETSSDLWFHPPMETLPADFFIVLVQPETPQQGVHTIESRTGSNLILAFQDRHACENFAEQLKAQNFVDPTPQRVSLESLDAFCHHLGVFAEFIPGGIDLIAPSQNVEHFGLKDPNLKEKRHELDYLLAMVELDIFDSEGALESCGSWE